MLFAKALKFKSGVLWFDEVFRISLVVGGHKFAFY